MIMKIPFQNFVDALYIPTKKNKHEKHKYFFYITF